ncbi:purine-cytosine permease family protein [Agrobacterium sp. NPDC090283]|uniref:purine-cytosine permease family protein n=1 Tax=Agrobacterium sp. NPDC090283 TaxID=3363920 RepID=UPI00383A454A
MNAKIPGTTSTDAAISSAEALKIETRSIDYIPDSERRGSAKDLFSLWFGANAMAITLVTGGIASTTGLGLFWSTMAILIGTLIGVVFMAYHSAQGPSLGLPQMIQSRAQFGFYGANFPLLIVVAMYLGFYAGGCVIGAQALQILLGLSKAASVAIVTIMAILLAIFGYKMMHVVARILVPIYILVFGVLTYALVKGWSSFPSSTAVATDTFQMTAFMMVLSIVAAYYISYGPYVADYSRYLPRSTKTSHAFWYTYAGAGASALWIMTLGAGVQAAFANVSTIEATANVANTLGAPFQIITLIVLVVGVININSLNIYGSLMSTLTITTTVFRTSSPSQTTRNTLIIVLGNIGGGLAAIASTDFVLAYENFIFFLITFLIPWSAVNLVDYYCIRNGKYDAESLFKPNSRYGRVNKIGMISYLIGCVCQIPFINQMFYTGSIAGKLGYDVAWIVGLIVPSVVYYVLAKKYVRD